LALLEFGKDLKRDKPMLPHERQSRSTIIQLTSFGIAEIPLNAFETSEVDAMTWRSEMI
jgi:hypothetical protein